MKTIAITSMKILNEFNTSGNNPLGIDTGNIFNILQFCVFYSIKIFSKLKVKEPLEVNVSRIFLFILF